MTLPRKLFRRALIVEMAKEVEMGVPISVIKRKHNLDCSNPHLAKHISYYQMFIDNQTVLTSLFPAWLNDVDDMQEEDGTHKYEGLFPWGTWIT